MAPAAAPQSPGLMGQMAATAGGVAIGSAVGHTIGHGITSLFSGGSSSEVSAPVATAPSAYQQPIGGGYCDQEFQQFVRCTQQQSDISFCQGFNEVLKECKMRYNVQ